MVTSADLHRRRAVQMVSMREVAMMRCADAVTMRGVDMQVAVTDGSMRRWAADIITGIIFSIAGDRARETGMSSQDVARAVIMAPDMGR